MNSEWTTFQSFQQSQSVLDAINTLAIHLKLERQDLEGDMPSVSVTEARGVLDSFLNELKKDIAQGESEGGLILGTGPRLRQFARRFARARRNPSRFHSPLMTGKIEQVQGLLQKKHLSEKESDDLLFSLDELKVLIEEHVDADASKLFGEI